MAALAAGGVPLALACRLLWRRGHPWAACAALAALGPAAVAATVTFEGFGPLVVAARCGFGEPAGVADVCAPSPAARGSTHDAWTGGDYSQTTPSPSPSRMKG